jgi:hypothetical protein
MFIRPVFINVPDDDYAMAERANSLFKRITMPSYRYPVTWYATTDLNGVMMSMKVKVLDRDSGESIDIATSIELRHVRSDEDLLRLAHDMLMRFATHEIDECFLLDGKRIRDPHANERR